MFSNTLFICLVFSEQYKFFFSFNISTVIFLIVLKGRDTQIIILALMHLSPHKLQLQLDLEMSLFLV